MLHSYKEISYLRRKNRSSEKKVNNLEKLLKIETFNNQKVLQFLSTQKQCQLQVSKFTEDMDNKIETFQILQNENFRLIEQLEKHERRLSLLTHTFRNLSITVLILTFVLIIATLLK
jgi:hypothetical protein